MTEMITLRSAQLVRNNFIPGMEIIILTGLKLFRELRGNNLYSWKELTSMDKYKEYYLEISPLPAQKKNRLVFKRPITWKAEGSEKTMTTWEEVLTLDLAPLQQDLVMKALSLFRDQEPKSGKKSKPLDKILGTTTRLERTGSERMETTGA